MLQKQFLPYRINLTHSVENKIKLIESLPKYDLRKIDGIGPKTKEKLIKAGIRDIKYLRRIKLSRLIKILDHTTIAKIVKGLDEYEKNILSKSQSPTGKKKKNDNIHLAIIAPDSTAKLDLDEVSDAIEVVAKFKSEIIAESSELFQVATTIDENRPDFWIQDMIIALQNSQEDATLKPVDDSLGEINFVALSYYSNQRRNVKNSYNKIYVDLVIKLLRIFDLHNQKKNNGEDTEEEEFTPRIDLIGQSYNDQFAEDLKKQFKDKYSFDTSNKHSFNRENSLKIDGGNMLRIGVHTLIGYDTLVHNNPKILAPLRELRKFKKHKKVYSFERLIKMPEVQTTINNYVKVCEKAEQDFKNKLSKMLNVKRRCIHLIGSKEVLMETALMDIDLLTEDGNDHHEKLTWINHRYTGQGIYHIDLFISAAGKSDGTLRNRVVVGQPIYTGERHIPLFHHTEKVINQIAVDLARTGLEVHRIPLPLTYVDEIRNAKESRRVWFFASYNNCLVQYTEEEKDRFVWLPVYGSDFSVEYIIQQTAKNGDPELIKCGDWSYLKPYDQKSSEVWKSLGFQVEHLTNYLPFAQLRGSIRCLSKVLYRKDYRKKKKANSNN